MAQIYVGERAVLPFPDVQSDPTHPLHVRVLIAFDNGSGTYARRFQVATTDPAADLAATIVTPEGEVLTAGDIRALLSWGYLAVE